MADDAGRLNQVFAETSFLYGSNASFIEDLHGKWAADPASVSGEWRAFFDQLRDNAETVKTRMAAYRAQTEPLLPYYGARGVLRKVDGMAAMDEVYRQITEVLAGT